MTRSIALVALVFASACSEFDLVSDPPAADAVNPAIEVSPQQLVYGELAAGESEVQRFVVTSVGEAPLTVDRIAIVSGDSFTILTDNLNVVLDPGHEKPVDVEFVPMGGNANFGQVMVYSDDPERPEVPVDLMGTGAVPELQITPSSYDFGSAFIPCGADVELTFENVGTEDLVIDDFTYTSGGMLSFSGNATLPLTLAPHETATATVHFDAATDATDFGELDVYSNDPRGVVSAQQTGAGSYVASNTDAFDVPIDPPVDILFAVDQSCSMDTEAAALGSAFGSFISTISSVTSGWQIGVVTHDTGCFNQGILTESTPDYIGKFQSAVTEGTQELWSEALLKLSDIALDKATTGQCNNGFLRAGAMLHIIVVSDEPEQSGTNWATWVSSLQAEAPDPALFKISAVVDLGTCGLGPDGYDDAAAATGGEILNICNANWASQVGVLASASLAGLNTFGLTDTPDASTIAVTVDGVAWTTGWSYDAGSNSIVFDDPQFDGGERIEVDYDVLADCP